MKNKFPALLGPKHRRHVAAAFMVGFVVFIAVTRAFATGTIVVTVQAQPQRVDPFGFETSGQITNTVSLADNGVPGANTTTFNNVPAGSTTIFRVASVVWENYTLSSINCSVNVGGTSSFAPNVSAGNVNINLQDGDAVACTFTNQLLSFAAVNSTSDADGDPNDCALPNGVCTLRKAIQFANANQSSVVKNITFSIPTSDPGYDPASGSYKIDLQSQLPSLAGTSIIGPGAGRLIIQRSSAVTTQFGIFDIPSDVGSIIQGVTIAGGSSVQGGGVFNAGYLLLSNDFITGNLAQTGGGVFNQGALTIRSSTLSGNIAYGAIFPIIRSNGGAISNMTPRGDLGPPPQLTVQNSTISGNIAVDRGGGINLFNGFLTVQSSTIANNLADLGGGINSGIGTASLTSCIVANNTAGTGAPDLSSISPHNFYNTNFCLIGNTSGALIAGVNNLLDVDPMLVDLAYNGGQTMTHALLPGSPALDMGINASGSAFDQRGMGFPRVFDIAAIPNATDGTDIGAFELRIYNFTGFSAPIVNPPDTNMVNSGNTVPIKFSLSGFQGLNIFAAGYPASQQIDCQTGLPVGSIEPIVLPGTATLDYTAFNDQYALNWKTDKTWTGQCRNLIVQFNDDVSFTRTANFNFR